MEENTYAHEVPHKTTTSNSSNSKSIIKKGRKRKRISSDSSNDDVGILPANSLEVEKNLQATAAKNNLNDKTVKKILKKVVLNDHVLAIVKLQEEEASGDEEENLSVKLTRSKAKQLKKSSPNWELTPIKHIPVKTRPEVKALIAQELPDESDEEYNPTHDDVPSDEDQTLESCSDIESQPRTPATPRSQPSTSPKQCIKDGPFKVPQELKTPTKHRQEIEEEATIALRTRSKLSLSETPIEHIEQSFVPPDEPPATAVDDLWNKFLEECLNPAPSFRNEDDDEADPEYNVAADPDAQDEDEEALENSLIKISRKELTDLMSELMHLMPEDVDIQTESTERVENCTNHSQCGEIEGKQERICDGQAEITYETNEVRKFRRNSCVSIGKSEPLSDEENLRLSNEDISLKVTAENEVSKEVINNENNCNNSETLNSRETQPVNRIQKVLTTSGENNVVTINLQERTEVMTPADREPMVPPVLKKTLEKDLESHEIEIRLYPIRDKIVLPEQVQILQQQLRQHIQLSTSNFLQLYVHPIHWKLAPKYKQYLETFMKLKKDNPKSVVDVCNLEPAMELVNSWEKSVSENTTENIEMIKFLQKEMDVCNRRLAQNAVYIGKFHPTFLQAVANSHVFLYPYLLPPVPFRTMKNRKNAYQRSEDELMACGLDQFWQLVNDNPALFKLPSRSYEFRRYGLTHVIDLIRRHMFPWLSHSTIQAHINHIRRLRDPANPINLFFSKREIVPVKHKLLSFNPNITLYEQPDHEMPLIWLRYIKSTSQNKRFITSRVKIQGVEPQGVVVDLGKTVKPPKKDPLPKDFTKMFKRNEDNKMVTIAPRLCDDYNPIQIHINTNTTQNENTSTTTSTAATSTTLSAPQTVTNLFNLVQTSVGAYLIPLAVVQGTTVVNSVQTPITTPNQDSTAAKSNVAVDGLVNKQSNLTSTIHFSDDEISESEEPNESKTEKVRVKKMNCCNCCQIVRSYIKRQRKITEYFHRNNKRAEEVLCPCHKQRLHKTNITNRLKLLVQNYRACSFSVWRHLDEKIFQLTPKCNDGMTNKKASDQSCDIRNSSENTNCEHKPTDYDNLKDIGFVTMFLMKILSGSATLKKQMCNHLTKFDPKSDSPVYLFDKLSRALKGEDFEITKDFVQFLTSEQALKVNRFGTYLLVSIVPLLIARIEEDVTENDVKISLLSELSSLCTDMGEFSPCNMCEKLLKHTKKYVKLTELIFSLFPHRRKSDCNQKSIDSRTPKEQRIEREQASQIEPNNETINDGIDNDGVTSMKNNVNSLSPQLSNKNQNDFLCETSDDDSQLKISKVENQSDSLDTPDDDDNDLEKMEQTTENPNLKYINKELPDTTKTESMHSRRSSEDSTTYASDSESMKYEIADWTRDEDKIVLEILKDTLTPTEMKDKTILEILEEKNVFIMLENCLEHKSAFDIRDRVLYLLDVLNKTTS